MIFLQENQLVKIFNQSYIGVL